LRLDLTGQVANLILKLLEPEFVLGGGIFLRCRRPAQGQRAQQKNCRAQPYAGRRLDHDPACATTVTARRF